MVRGGETMALLTVEGIYKDGKVELAEHPKLVEDSARVLVTFLPPSDAELAGENFRKELRRRAFARMREGIDLGGPPYPSREEIYDRFG
jgi:hypothetical protein